MYLLPVIRCFMCFIWSSLFLFPELTYSLKITEKSDFYSYGVILFELLTGCGLFDPNSVKEETLSIVF